MLLYLNRYSSVSGGIGLAVNQKDTEIECCEEHLVHMDAVDLARSEMPGDELCVCDIAALLGMSQSAISHQLRFLKQARLVRSRKNGKTVYYALCDDHIQIILAQGIAHVQEG